jgi:GxxExxY protein
LNANDREYVEEVVKTIVGAAFEVSNTLGAGFLEKVYERALTVELVERGLKVETQVSIPVHYKGHEVGNYVADMVVEGKVLLELKCSDVLTNVHMAQCINYLRATDLNICLPFNFQKPKLEWKRIVHNY